MAAPNGTLTDLSPSNKPDASPPGTIAQTINLGSRSSKLALIQANNVSDALSTAHPNYKFPIQSVMVRGDADKTTPFLQMADASGRPDAAKSLWTEEMEIMLAAGSLDMLVHCLKDLPTILPDGCVLGAILMRADPSDALVVKAGLPYTKLSELPDGSVVGTSSTRRKALLKRSYPRLIVKECRGNVPTRLRKLDDPAGDFSCIILATAGLERLDLHDRITRRLDPLEFPYAVGQAALAIEVREGDTRIAQLLHTIEHSPTRWQGLAERAMLRTLQGGCSSPVGVHSYTVDAMGEDRAGAKPRLHLEGWVIHPDGQSEAQSGMTAEVASDEQAEALGKKVAGLLLTAGADKILAQIRQLNANVQIAHMEPPTRQEQSTPIQVAQAEA